MSAATTEQNPGSFHDFTSSHDLAPGSPEALTASSTSLTSYRESLAQASGVDTDTLHQLGGQAIGSPEQ